MQLDNALHLRRGLPTLHARRPSNCCAACVHERRADMLFGFWFSGHLLTLRGGPKRYDHTRCGEKEGGHYEEDKIAHLKFSYNDQFVYLYPKFPNMKSKAGFRRHATTEVTHMPLGRSDAHQNSSPFHMQMSVHSNWEGWKLERRWKCNGEFMGTARGATKKGDSSFHPHPPSLSHSEIQTVSDRPDLDLDRAPLELVRSRIDL